MPAHHWPNRIDLATTVINDVEPSRPLDAAIAEFVMDSGNQWLVHQDGGNAPFMAIDEIWPDCPEYSSDPSFAPNVLRAALERWERAVPNSCGSWTLAYSLASGWTVAAHNLTISGKTLLAVAAHEQYSLAVCHAALLLVQLIVFGRANV